MHTQHALKQTGMCRAGVTGDDEAQGISMKRQILRCEERSFGERGNGGER